MSDLANLPEIDDQLTIEDRTFVALLEQGFSKPEAYKEAYKDNEAVIRHQGHIRFYEEALADHSLLLTEEEAMEGKKLSYTEVQSRLAAAGRQATNSKSRLGQLAREKARTKKIRLAFHTLSRRMEDLAYDALDVIDDIMNNGRSEKVRGDLAIRMLEHQTGQTTQKVLSHSNNEIVITVGEAPEDTRDPKLLAKQKAELAHSADKVEQGREEARGAMEIDLEFD